MTNSRELYRPWMINGTYFNRMLECGARANSWIEHALAKCVSRAILDEWKDNVAFVSTANSDAFRIAKKTREEREIVFVSEHIIPPHGVSEDHPDVRYFIFVVLHEFVHVIKQHLPPNEISEEANNAQEAEANNLAFQWINGYINDLNHPDVRQFTEIELAAAQEKNRAKLNLLQ